MPRIDPERLLKTLAPLLDPNTGGIKSDKEVDKIYGLMSKFSRKLVSKVIYINILKASNPEVLDLYLQRGGWDMVHGWTVDANNKKNFTLLKEIGELLLNAPASIQRLKENQLPKVIKNLSKDCENEEIRELAKQVVTKWIAIAKQQDNPAQITNCKTVQVHNQIGTQESSVPGVSANPSGYSNIKLENSIVGESESTAAEFDISAFEINEDEILAFDPDDLEAAVDEHLGDFTSADPNPNTSNNDPQITQISNNQFVGMETPSSQQIKVENHIPPASDANFPRAPKILIKTVGGSAVVQSVGINETKQENAPYCIMMKDGKPFLVRLKLAPPSEISLVSSTAGDQEADNKTPQSTEVAEKKRRPRKDPTITNMRNLNLAPERHRPNILKTYSKKEPIEPITNESLTTPSVSEASSPTVKNKSLDKESKDKSEEKKSSSSTKKHRSGSKSGSVAAAAAAKNQADEDKLREKIKKEKVMLKKRAKEAAKQKQQEKDQETLKKLNLSSMTVAKPTTSSPPSMKIPKIPKKQSSFADAIGIPGASECPVAVAEKAPKDKKSLSKQSSMDTSEPIDAPGLSATKFYGKKEETAKTESQERRHRVKVFTSKKSRNDDLLKDMTETVKTNKSNKVESNNKGNDSKSALMGEKSLAGNSLIIIKPEKRPSVDGIEKPGDVKKQKLSSSDEKSDKKKEAKEREIKLSKEKAKAAAVIKESSLFMDALAASTEVHKPMSKRKRRLSSSNEKEVKVEKNSPNTAPKEKPASPTADEGTESVKPVFNFYRDTLGDNESPTDESTKSEKSATVDDGMDVEILGDNETSDEPNTIDAFTPTEDELKLKSALVIHRSRNKPKKSVRFRAEDELTEFFEFALDETERVNVTKQKDFTSMKQHEKAEEKEFLAKNIMRRILGADEPEEKMPWRKLIPIILETEPAACISEEKGIQEERERINLGVFLPPGSILPESPAEPDPTSPNASDRIEPRTIPSEDVLNVTKVIDYRTDVWPNPKGVTVGPRSPKTFGVMQRLEQQNFGIPNFNIPPEIPLNQSSPIPTGFPPPVQNTGLDFNNPWNINGVSMQAPPNTSNLGEMPGFSGLGANMMGAAGALGFPMPNMGNPFGIPIQNPPPGFIPPGINFPHPNQMIPNTNMNRDAHQSGLQNASRGRGGGNTSGRDFGDRDLRRPFKDSRESRDSRSRDYDNRTRSRDYRSRDHDRDRRSPSPSRRRRDDRERDRHSRDDKDYRDHDYRSRTNNRSGKKEIPCRFFKKGHCNSGSRCEFSHGEPGPDPSNDRTKTDNTRGRHSSPALMNGNEGISTSNIDLNSIESQFERRPSREEATTFTDAPMSPTDEIQEDPSLLLTTVTEPAKIIPVE